MQLFFLAVQQQWLKKTGAHQTGCTMHGPHSWQPCSLWSRCCYCLALAKEAECRLLLTLAWAGGRPGFELPQLPIFQPLFVICPVLSTPAAAAATYQVADANGVVYGDGEPHLCPTTYTADVQASALGLTSATATWTHTITKPNWIWGFKVRRLEEFGVGNAGSQAACTSNSFPPSQLVLPSLPRIRVTHLCLH